MNYFTLNSLKYKFLCSFITWGQLKAVGNSIFLNMAVICLETRLLGRILSLQTQIHELLAKHRIFSK